VGPRACRLIGSLRQPSEPHAWLSRTTLGNHPASVMPTGTCEVARPSESIPRLTQERCPLHAGCMRASHEDLRWPPPFLFLPLIKIMLPATRSRGSWLKEPDRELPRTLHAIVDHVRPRAQGKSRRTSTSIHVHPRAWKPRRQATKGPGKPRCGGSWKRISSDLGNLATRLGWPLT
jgi:hypothetical protein